MKIPYRKTLRSRSIIAILIFQFCLAHASNKNQIKKSNLNNILQNTFRRSVNTVFSGNDFYQFASVDFSSDLSPNCSVHLAEFFTQLNTSYPSIWAIEMFDAWAKFPEGILSGHINPLGDFDECLRIRARVDNGAEESSSFKGKYCLAYLGINSSEFETIPVNLQIGTCFPSSCSRNDVTQFLTTAIKLFQFPINMLNTRACYTDDKPDFTTGDITMIIVAVIISGLCLLGTCIDIFYRKSPISEGGVLAKLLLAFSIPRNTKKWLNTQNNGDNLGCIHGIRFFSTCWIILGHTWSMVAHQPVWNLKELYAIPGQSLSSVLLLNGYLAVDTFFAIGGILVAITLLKLFDKRNGKINIPALYAHRYLRLTPTYAIMIGIAATWFPYLNSGPNWFHMEDLASYCKRNWWHNLLYINNLINYSTAGDDAMCHGDSWYLANDMQFFIISPFLLYPLWKCRRLGLPLLAIVTGISIALPVIITYILDMLPTFMVLSNLEDTMKFTKHGYMKPWMRFSPYLVGLWAGSLIYKGKIERSSLAKIQKPMVVFGWCFSTAVALAVIFGLESYYGPGKEISRTTSAIYAGIHRLAWGIVISWIVFACTFGYGGLVNTFLSWKVFIPLGRLSFCVYIISYNLQLLYHLRYRQATSYDPYSMWNHPLLLWIKLFFILVVIQLLSRTQMQDNLCNQHSNQYKTRHGFIECFQAESYISFFITKMIWGVISLVLFSTAICILSM